MNARFLKVISCNIDWAESPIYWLILRRWPNHVSKPNFTDTMFSVVLLCICEAWPISTARIERPAQLNLVILPEADRTDKG